MDQPALTTLLADGAPHSGAALAARFGVTRAAVWKQIEALRALGLPVETVTGRGYRLAWPLELLDADRLRTELPAGIRARLGTLDVRWETDSTSSELLRRAAGLPDLSLCFAERQTAGRGRRGRAWASPPGGNLYLSLLKRFDGGMAGLSGLSLAVGVALMRALAACGARGCGLKWPNDVLADGRKLAGILVELGGEFLGPCHAVIGIGVNLRLPPALCVAIDQPVADLHGITAEPPGRHRFAAALIGHLIEALDEFVAHGFAPFRAAFEKADLLRGQPLRVLTAQGVREGVGAGVDARGALCVQSGAGMLTFDSADVSVRET